MAKKKKKKKKQQKKKQQENKKIRNTAVELLNRGGLAGWL